MHIRPHNRLYNRNPNERLPPRAQRGRDLAVVRLKRYEELKINRNIF